MELAECDLCGNRDFEAISQKDRHGEMLETVACRQCGLVRHAVVPTEQELQEFYSTNYRKAYNGESSPGVRRIMRAWKNGTRICRQVQPHLKPQGRVLEVGAGIGCTVKVFDQNGFNAEGIDPGSEFLAFSRDKLKAKVHTANVYDLPRHSDYDAILLVHVIEHVRSPRAALEHIAGLIKPGGMFYVECPNLQAPFARRSRLFHTAHIHNFVPSTLMMLARSCGFQLVQRFGDEQDPNLQMLFQHCGEPQMEIDSANYQRTVHELARTNAVPYTLRLRYLRDRLKKLVGYVDEYARAQRFVDQLIKDCGGLANSPVPSAALANRAA